MKHAHQTNRVGWEKGSVSKALIELWRDMQVEPEWKYQWSSPVKLLEKLGVNFCLKDNHELVRAAWFWGRRPRFLRAVSSLLWLSVAIGLPFWLFVIPSIGFPLIIVAAVTINTDLVQSTRWRRQYESSIERLIRTVAVHESGGAPGSDT